MSIPIEKVVTDRFTMNYFRFGSGDKCFVILPGLSIQSVMGSADIIAGAYEPLTKDFTVYVFDRRSDLPDAYSIYDMADDTAQALSTLGLSDIYLFGASQGGMLAMTIAVNHPELVKKLMLGSTAAKITEEQNNALSKWSGLAKSGEGQKLYVQFCSDIYPDYFFEKYKSTFELIGGTVSEEDLHRFTILADGTKGFDITEKLRNIPCPVLNLCSADDKVLPGGGEEITKILTDIPYFEHYTYDGYGHAAFDTAPDYKQRLLDFCLK